jgi:hypothetical protein
VAAAVRNVGDDRMFAPDEFCLEAFCGLVIQQAVPPVAGDVLRQDDDRDRRFLARYWK